MFSMIFPLKPSIFSRCEVLLDDLLPLAKQAQDPWLQSLARTPSASYEKWWFCPDLPGKNGGFTIDIVVLLRNMVVLLWQIVVLLWKMMLSLWTIVVLPWKLVVLPSFRNMLVVFLVSFTMKDGDLSRNGELNTIGSGIFLGVNTQMDKPWFL